MHEKNKVVVNQVNQPGYLHLDEIPFNETLILSMAPLNSSGDIYHILAYLILAKHFNKKLPQVELTFDVKPSVTSLVPTNKGPVHSNLTVGDQVNRSEHFASTLGFSQNFKKVEQTFNKVGRENVRHDELVKHLKKQAVSDNKNMWYVDQMATTALIAAEFKKNGYGPTAEIIRQGYSLRDVNYFPVDIQLQIDTTVASWMTCLENTVKMKNQSLVVLQVRYSKNANNEQNIPDNFLTGLTNILTNQAGYQVCVLLADDRNKQFNLGDTACTISPFKKNLFFKNNKDFAKQAHLQFLLKLKQLPRIKAVVGNTSGTLDLAALIGLNTYSIHQFGVQTISYQECRLFMQLEFMAIDALLHIGNGFSLSTSLENWLKKPAIGHEPAHWVEKDKIKQQIMNEKDQAGFKKMFSMTLFKQNNTQETKPMAASIALLA